MNPLVLKALYLVGGSGAAVGGAVATGVIPASFITGLWSAPKVEVARLVEPAPKIAPIVKVEPKIQEPKAEEKKADVTAPKFDILRLEKDGSVLVAGNAAPNSKVELLDRNGTVLGSTTAGPEGDFVILPDKPLQPGGYSLSLRATDPAGAAVMSKQAGILNVPKPGEETALAMVSEEGAPSRVITKPKALEAIVQEPPKAEPVADKPIEVAAAPKPEPAPVVVAAKPEPAPEPKPAPAPAVVPKAIAPNVVVEAVEVEGKKVFVAGAAKSGSLVRVYINNEQLGTTRGTADNRFLIIRNYQLKAGNHSVRADLVSSSSGKVISRAEVPLVHEVQVAAEPTAVPEPVQIAKAEEPAPQQQAVTTDALEEPAEPLRTGTAVIIKPGDNLWRISRRTYGAGIRYTTIYNANRDQIRDPSRIYVGQIFKIPESEASSTQ